MPGFQLVRSSFVHGEAQRDQINRLLWDSQRGSEDEWHECLNPSSVRLICIAKLLAHVALFQS